MGCCLVAALVVSVLRRGWHTVTRRPPSPAPFPPPARRGPPGSRALVAPATATVAVRPILSVPVAVAGSVLLLAVSTTASSWAGLVRSPDPAVPPLVADLLLACLVVSALLVAPRWTTGSRETARALSAAGATWTTVVLVEMHGLRTLVPATTVVDVVLHGVGLSALYLGLARWRPLASRPTSGALS